MLHRYPPMHNLNEPNQLVSHQFTPDAFSMVQQVYFHLGTLKHIAENLRTVDTVGREMYKLDGLNQYLGDIVRVSDALNAIVSIQRNLPVISELAPRIEHFVCQLDDIQEKINRHEVSFKEAMATINCNVKLLEDMYIQYECGLTRLIEEYKANLCEDYTKYKNDLVEYSKAMQQQHAEFKHGMRVLKEAVQVQDETKLLLEHLKASDAVTDALFLGSEEASAKALKQIKESEKWGNNEDVNRQRLNYKLPENRVFNVMHANYERLLKDEGEDLC